MRWLLAAGLLALCAASSRAQGVGLAIEAELPTISAKKKKPKEEAPPLALALNLAFGATVWAEVRISTDGPLVEMSRLVRQGYYKLELIELILMASQGRTTLKKTLEKRKKGASLAAIAADYHLDYDRIYESSLAVQEVVDQEYLPRFPEKRRRKVGEE